MSDDSPYPISLEEIEEAKRLCGKRARPAAVLRVAEAIAKRDARIAEAREVLGQYVEFFGGIHEQEGCPEDDTCTCRWTRLTNEALGREA